MFFGGEVSRYPGGYIAALLVTAGAWFLVRSSGAANLRHGPAMVLYFGPCWWFLGLGPLVVVGYESTRHVYLASVGWAMIWAWCFTPSGTVGMRRSADDAGRECGPARLLHRRIAGGSRRVECQGAGFPESGRRPRARGSRDARRKPADCRRAGAELGVGVARSPPNGPSPGPISPNACRSSHRC